MSLQPKHNCSNCPRLFKFREENRIKFPDKFNAPVPSFGSNDAELLIVGLAPGLKGANFTGRPFTGDFAGDFLYDALRKQSLTEGQYKRHGDDNIKLLNCRITNAVRCVPPQNKPTGDEILECNDFLRKEISSLPNLRIIISLGTISHNAVLKSFKLKQSAYKFGHGHQHKITLEHLDNPIALLDSYHCSRYNTNTGRITEDMFQNILISAKSILNN